ncbi:hypothetical protein NUW54_g9240 [Trametes sanguinea]|uniref:Uncharacterized protein n=1 Tax=Trametes sanguinea TaxID=158606 RepID=A0ACC1P965_9APHY|nr:hypothetical protein NUW54_g9240 [Trametes sanguinea]
MSLTPIVTQNSTNNSSVNSSGVVSGPSTPVTPSFTDSAIISNDRRSSIDHTQVVANASEATTRLLSQQALQSSTSEEHPTQWLPVSSGPLMAPLLQHAFPSYPSILQASAFQMPDNGSLLGGGTAGFSGPGDSTYPNQAFPALTPISTLPFSQFASLASIGQLVASVPPDMVTGITATASFVPRPGLICSLSQVPDPRRQHPNGLIRSSRWVYTKTSLTAVRISPTFNGGISKTGLLPRTAVSRISAEQSSAADAHGNTVHSHRAAHIREHFHNFCVYLHDRPGGAPDTWVLMPSVTTMRQVSLVRPSPIAPTTYPASPFCSPILPSLVLNSVRTYLCLSDPAVLRSPPYVIGLEVTQVRPNSDPIPYSDPVPSDYPFRRNLQPSPPTPTYSDPLLGLVPNIKLQCACWMRATCPELQYCESDWKTHDLAKTEYPQWKASYNK